MTLTSYRRVLALPGVARLLAFAVLARVPQTAVYVVITLHVVTTLHRGYGAAGLVAAVATVGMAIGGPWRGRAIDRVGLRRALLPSVLVATAAWVLAPLAGYGALLVLAFVGGLLALPIFSVTRQCLAVLVPGDRRRTVLALDSVGTELSFMMGPALGVRVATQVSTTAAMLGIGALMFVSGLGLILLDPPTRSVDPGTDPGSDPGTCPGTDPENPAARADVEVGAGPEAGRPARSQWFSPALIAVLAATAGGTVVLSGTDVAIVAHLRESGNVQLTGLIFVAWGTGSILGGLVYGGLHRRLSPFGLLLGLAVLTVPVGLAHGPLILMLTILPAAALCAPVITSTIEAVARMVPEQVRGEAMGWHGSALQAGSALGAPLAGVAMDASGAWAGFVVVGLGGAMIAVLGLAVQRVRLRSADRAVDGRTAPLW